MVKAIEYLKNLSYLPATLQRGKGREVYGRPSNEQLRRWLNMGSIVINGKTPKSLDEISFPIWQLIFFPKGKRRTIIIDIVYHSGGKRRLTKYTIGKFEENP